MDLKYIKDKTIIITNYEYKVKILEELNKNSELLDISFLDMRELKEKVYFSYDENAIYYLMDKYNLKYDIAVIYLENMYVLENKDYKSNKLKYLLNLKKELIDNNLLFVDNLFLNHIKDRNVIFWGYNYFSKDEEALIEKVGKYSSVQIVDKVFNHYNHDVYRFTSIYDEVEYVANKIASLIDSGVSISNIKLTNVDNDYVDIMKDVFKMYNLDIINSGKMISTKVCSMFLEMEGSIEKRIDYLKDKYKNSEVLEKLIKIVNKYIIFKNIDIVNEMIKCELKNTNIPSCCYGNTIEIIDYLNYPVSDLDYVFMVNFNQNSIPKLFKDEGYITDDIKDEVCLDLTANENKKMREAVCKNILNIRNLIITYKDTTPFKNYFPSDLIDDLGFNVVLGDVSLDHSYSEMYNEIKLGKMLDNYVKTGSLDENINYLYSNYSDINFSSYDNKYKGISKKSFLDYIDNHFELAYSSMDNYYKCPFRYYLSNVMKINIYEEKFEAYLGSLFHYVLENHLKDNKNIRDLMTEFIDNNERVLDKKEQFFVNKLEKDIIYVADVIKEQLDNSDLKKMLFEDRIAIEKKYGNVSVTFKGFVDKIMYEKEDDKTIVAIIDYKTGPMDVKLGYVPYGLYLQLPVYLYLAKNSNQLENVTFAGFYLQRVLNSEVNISNKKSYDDLKREQVLLYGYSNSDEEILHKFDNTYKNSKYIKSMKVKKDGSFSSYANVLNNDQINRLIDVVDDKVDCAIHGISEAMFDIKPKRTEKEVLGCSYCKFNDICFKENDDEEIIAPDNGLSFLGGDLDA